MCFKVGQILAFLYLFIGFVSCTITLNSGVESESKMPVNVLPKPTITIDQHTITSTHNKTISIQCESHVADLPQAEKGISRVIKWYKNGEVLNKSGKSLHHFLKVIGKAYKTVIISYIHVYIIDFNAC